MRILPALLLALVISLLAVACGGDDDDAETAAPTTGATTAAATATTPAKPSGTITVYSGRSETLVKPLIEQFMKDTGIDVKVKYAGTSELAALLVEEGSKSPADVYFAQDAGALGAVSDAKLLDTLPAKTIEAVPATYRSAENTWVGVSGRARVIVYNPDLVKESDLPSSVKQLTDPKWKGVVGWAPSNASFQSAVTAHRRIEGEAAAKKWLEDMQANGTKTYKDNNSIVTAVSTGEISLGLVNHYYLYGFLKDQGDGFKARNHYTAAGDVGSLVNVAGAAILKTSANKPAAQAFVDYMLSEKGQKYFSDQTFEYPLVNGIAADKRLKPLSEIRPPALDLSKLDDLQGSLTLLRSTGVLK